MISLQLLCHLVVISISTVAQKASIWVTVEEWQVPRFQPWISPYPQVWLQTYPLKSSSDPLNDTETASGPLLLVDLTCAGVGSKMGPRVQTYLRVVEPLFLQLKAATSYGAFQNNKEMVILAGSAYEELYTLCIADLLTDMGFLVTQIIPQHKHNVYLLFGNGGPLDHFLHQIRNNSQLSGDIQWIISMSDVLGPRLNTSGVDPVTMVEPDRDAMCLLLDLQEGCSCEGENCYISSEEIYFHYVMKTVTAALGDTGDESPSLKERLKQGLEPRNIWLDDETIVPRLKFNIMQDNTLIATWTYEDGIVSVDPYINKRFKRRLRVVLKHDPPFVIKMEKSDGSAVYDGFFVRVLVELQKELDFQYTLVEPPDGIFGEVQPDGSWTGMVGMLVRGEVDILLAPMSIQMDLEKVLDFVIPYMDVTGIGILARRPDKPKFLFKFLKVLREEVWLGVLGSLIVSGVAIWLVERLSPYSLHNRRRRDEDVSGRTFDFKECLWFVLTSFTPQGGGEVPLALSSKILIAFYWLFVLLILATFTANLAALLTVERMKTQVKSIDEMVKKVDFKYTTIANSSTYRFFQEMARAEEVLYSAWLNLSTDPDDLEFKFLIWDYPIREQYKQFLKMIDETGPIATIEEAVERVRGDLEGNFAVLMNAATARFYAMNDCNLLTIGEAFGERPYSFAVRKGSDLAHIFGLKMTELIRYLIVDNIMDVYWNDTKKRLCPDDAQSLSLQDLGGIFIVTAVGVVIGLVALAVETMGPRRPLLSLENLKNPKPPRIVASDKVVDRAPSLPKISTTAWGGFK